MSITFRHMLFVKPMGDDVWDEDNAPMVDGEKITPVNIMESGLVIFERWSNGHRVTLSPGMFTLDPNHQAPSDNMEEGSPFGLIRMSISTIMPTEDSDDVSIMIEYPDNNSYFLMGAEDAILMGHTLLRRGSWAKALEASLDAFPVGKDSATREDVIESIRAGWNAEEEGVYDDDEQDV